MKMEKKLQKIYLRCYNLLIVWDLWKAHCQILSIIFLNEFIQLHVNSNVLKNVRLVELNMSIVTVFLNTQILRTIEYNTNLSVVTKIINTSLMKCLKNDFSIHKNFLITTIINLFYCCKKVFILLVIWVIGKHLMKHNYLEKKILQSLKYGRYYWCRLRACKESF